MFAKPTDPNHSLCIMATSEQEIDSSAATTRRFAAAGVVPFLITLAAGALCYGLFYRRGLGLAVIGYSIAPTERVLRGEVPYRDFLFNYTPGILWLNALLMKWLGVSLVTVRIGLLAVKLVTLVLVYGVGRRLTNGLAALVPVVLTLAWLGYEHIFNPYPDVYFMPFALAGMLCALNYDRSGKARWLMLGGLAVGVVFLFKHNVGVFVFLCGLVVLWLREAMAGDFGSRAEFLRGIIRRSAIYFAGFAGIVIATLAYLYSQHALGAMIEHFRHHAAAYSEARSIGLPSVRQLWPLTIAFIATAGGALLLFRYRPRYLVLFFVVTTLLMMAVVLWPNRAFVFKQSAIAGVAYLPPVLFAAVIMAALWPGSDAFREALRNPTWRRRVRELWESVFGVFRTGSVRRQWWRRNGVTISVMLFALGVYLEMFPRADYYHLVRVLPPVFLLLLIGVWRVRPLIETALRDRLAAASGGWLIAFVPLALLVAAGWQATWRPQFDGRFRFVDRKELTIDRGRHILVGERQAALVEGLAKLIQDNSTAEDAIFSFSQRASAFYFLSGRRNPTRFLWWRSVGISREERDAVMGMISNREPKLIIVQEIAATQKTRDFVGQYYRRLGAAADLAVYGRE